MAAGNVVNIIATTFLKTPKGDYEVRNDDLSLNEWDTLNQELQFDVSDVLEKAKFRNIFRLSNASTGGRTIVNLTYRGPSRNLDKHVDSFIKDLNNKTNDLTIETHEGYFVYLSSFGRGDLTVLEPSMFTVQYSGVYEGVSEEGTALVNVSPDDSVSKLINQFAVDRGLNKRKCKFLAFDSYGAEIKGFQTKLRKCCFDGKIELRFDKKPAPVPRAKSPRAKSPRAKSPRAKSPRAKSPKSGNGRKARAQSPYSPRNKPASRVTTIDRSRLIAGRAGKKSNAYSVQELKELLKERGLKQTGKKDELVARLRAHA